MRMGNGIGVSKASPFKRYDVVEIDIKYLSGKLNKMDNNAKATYYMYAGELAMAQYKVELAIENFEKVIDVNLDGVFLCTKYASEQMKKQGKGGKIINVASIDALHPSMVGLSAYDASKHGVWGFTKNAALELAPFKIWVNSIAPGGIATPGVAKMQSQENSAGDGGKAIEEFMAKIPMGRIGEPDDIGKVALFLASDMSSYMTGSQIVVDGGVLLS